MVRRGCPDGWATPSIHATPSPALGVSPLPTVRGQRVAQGPSAFLQGHGGFARRNQFGTFQVKNEQNKTETRTKFQKTKTTKTEQKTTDKLPTAGQRVVHFRALAYALTIIGVAAACGLSVCPPLVLAIHAHCACTPLALVWPCRVAPPARLCVPPCGLRIDHAPVS